MSNYIEVVTETRALLQHFLAALAYRTQKALRDSPDSFADFRAGPTTRTPRELVWHMTGVIGYARTMFHGGRFTPPELPTFADEVARFHETLAGLSAENFIFARVRADNVTAHQPAAEAPDQWWRPEDGHLPPGTHASKLADDIRESDRQ